MSTTYGHSKPTPTQCQSAEPPSDIGSIWKLRERAERAEANETRLSNELMKERQEMERVKGLRLADTAIFNDEMERVKRREAAMRNILITVDHFCSSEDPDWTDLDGQMVRDALSDTAGSDFIPRADVDPLVEALRYAYASLHAAESEDLWHRAVNAITEAIAHARSKGWCK